MLKVILLVVLFNTQSGELGGVWTENGKLPTVETLQQCEEIIAKHAGEFLSAAPKGFTVSAQCIFPGKDVKDVTTT